MVSLWCRACTAVYGVAAHRERWRPEELMAGHTIAVTVRTVFPLAAHRRSGGIPSVTAQPYHVPETCAPNPIY
jgi:hypothetical protein